MKDNYLLLRNSLGRIVLIPKQRIRTIIEAFSEGDNSTWAVSLDDGDVLVFYASKTELGEQLGIDPAHLGNLEGFSIGAYGHVPPKPENEEENSSEDVPEIEES